MTKAEFLRELESQEIGPRASTPTTGLVDADGWDSVAAPILLSPADKKSFVSLSGDQLAASATINDLPERAGVHLTD